jgi:hypothetical protein
MHRKHILALGGATLALIAAPAVANATRVTVRVEGKTKTLLAATTVSTKSGWITKDGVPAGKCSASSGLGALNVATHRRWAGRFSNSLNDYFIQTILGETDNGPKYYWSIFVNNVSALTGGCGIKLHRGDRLLFAATIYPEFPLGLSGPASATAGRTFKVRTVGYNAAGKPKALGGVLVKGPGVNVVSNRHGIVKITTAKVGKLVLHASKKGWIRAAALTVRVK